MRETSAKQPNSTQEKPARPFGTVYYVSGEQYKGEWKDNRRHGQGVVTYKNGDKYGGEWQEGKRHGNGTLWVLRGGKYKVRYTGDWQHGLPQGSGLLFDEEGNSYEGEFEAGLRHGRGRAVVAAAAAADGGGGPGGCIGSGGATTTAGDVYEGCWQHDKRHGPGTLMLANGDMFEGHWEQDLKHGPGTFFYMAKGCRYDGIWHQGTPRCGSYSEVQPAPPGAPGSIPNIELCNPEEVLQEGAAAAAGMSMAFEAAESAAATVAGLGSMSGSAGRHYAACIVSATGDRAGSVVGADCAAGTALAM